MTEKQAKKVGVIKTERTVAKDGSGYVEKTVNVYGDDLGKVHKIFKEEWEKE